ncbi:programmed cell death 6-interacting protein-like [Hyalella azteca]|uniref:Programmed cell death 6-interacting protein-like n=1 Tax=Hyalella azteca TaxID=294128 RepID=A0A8B7NTU7_HYAAZ|nr:programmed cell death 6-interacting protein-like [Hyalella azteca]
MAFKSDLFGIPLKRASDVDVLKPLKNLIISRYQSTEQESFINAVNEFAKLRSNAVGKKLDYHENSLELLYRYYDQLVALEGKIPAAEIQIPFKWKDAFEKGSIFGSRTSKTVPSLSYEKACVMFNIAALQSQVAAVQSPDSDDGLKLAAKLLQQSSGAFNNLKGWVLSAVGSEPTADLQPDTLTALSAFMLAQAQEVCVSKAIKERMKSAVIAKLCMQCEELYGEASKQMGREILKPLWDRDWIARVAGKQLAFNALAQFYQSRVCNEEKSVDEEISRLRHALELFKSAETRSGNAGQVVDQIARAQSLMDEAVKYNDFIYHERVPEVRNLSAIEKAALAKVLPVPERFSTNFTDLFESLVPVQVQQALSQCDVRRQDIVNKEVSKLKGATQLLNSVLASLNLPAAVEETAAGEQLPPSLREKSAAVVEKGGLESLERIMKELPELLQRNTELLDECERQLKEEADSDSQLREQFKEKWTRTPSATLTATFQANAAKYRKVIETAVAADSTVRGKLDANREGMEMLSRGPESLASSLPSPSSGGASGDSPPVVTLRKLMEEVEAIKAEREVIENELKCATVNISEVFLAALAADGAINEPALSTEKLGEVFRDMQRQVSDSLTRQERLIVNIQESHEEFMAKSGRAGGERERLLKMVAARYDVFMELTDNLREGTKFYNDLTQLLVKFQSKITDYCFARRTEKEELLKDLTSGLASANTGPTPQAPAHHATAAAKTAPPRPPPPATASAPAPPTAGNPYQGAPYSQPGQLPYPVQPQGMPAPPPGYAYPLYPVYMPMPQGYNPYFAPPQGYPQAPYPTQGGYAPGYPQQPPPTWPPKP